MAEAGGIHGRSGSWLNLQLLGLRFVSTVTGKSSAERTKFMTAIVWSSGYIKDLILCNHKGTLSECTKERPLICLFYLSGIFPSLDICFIQL